MSKKKLIAIGAHADDIELDVGGTLLKYKNIGYEIAYVMSTDNMSGKISLLDNEGFSKKLYPSYRELMPIRKREAETAARVLEAKPIHLNYPQRHYRDDDGAFHEIGYGVPCPDHVEPGIPSILTAHEHDFQVNRVANLLLEHDAEAVLTHGNLGENLEHVATCLLVTKAFYEAQKKGFRGALLYWHCIAATLFRANYCDWDTFIDVSDVWENKLDLVSIHQSQKPNARYLDYPEWGAACGCKKAEVFTIAHDGVPPLYYSPFSIEIFHNRK